MHSLRHFIVALLLLTGFTSAQANELEEQLALFIPGTSIEESAGRLYAQRQLEALFTGLESQRINRKKPRKMLALLQGEVEDAFLKTYNPRANFHDLIKKGQFNQNTATVLYALIFNHLKLAYTLQIRVKDLVLLPQLSESNKFLDIPKARLLNDASAERYREAYVKLIRATNYPQINQQQQNDDELYKRYYLADNQILSLPEAAAFINYQQALFAFQNKAWHSCKGLLIQARQLHSHAMIDILERAVWLQLANQGGNSPESTYYLWKLWDEQPGQPWQDELLLHFDYQVQHLPYPSEWRIDSIYTDFQKRFGNHTSAQACLREHYFVVSAQERAEAGRTVEVLNLMDSLYTRRPADTTIHNLLAEVMVWSLRKERRFQEGLQRIAYYQQHYPFLIGNSIFEDQHLFYQAERVNFYFNNEYEQEGLHYLTTFEQLLTNTGPTIRTAAWVTTAYLAASNYYFRQANYPQARLYIARALQHAPKDDYLLHRQELLQRY